MSVSPERSYKQHAYGVTRRSETAFIYVKIPVSAGRPTRNREREHQIDEVLTEKNIGMVLGWGSSLGEERNDGSRSVAFDRIDIEVADVFAARHILHELLPKLGAPAGTEIHYKQDGANLQDVYSCLGWVLGQLLPSK
jgi:hypothetical protein